MKPYHRFHYIYSFQYIRYAFLLSVLPLIRALLIFDLPSLITALKQDGIIFIVVMLFSIVQWLAAGYRYSGGRITIQQGVLLSRQTVISRPMIAAIELRQPLYCRLLGACVTTIYYKHRPKPVTLCLFYQDALQLADEILPLKRESAIFRAVGAERLRFTVLSANLITTSILTIVSAKKTASSLGDELNQFAFSNLERMEKFIEQIFPVGLAWVTCLIFVLASIALLFSFLYTAGFVVCRNGGVIVAKGGLITKTERRILASAVTACDVRTTPIARLLRCSTVYLHAGGFSGSDMPVMVYRRGNEEQLQKLMPEFYVSHSVLGPVRGRSLIQFIWLSGSAFLFFISLTAVSAWLMPDIAPLLGLPSFLLFISLLVSLEAFFTESVRRSSNRTLELSYSRFLTRHRVCIFTSQTGFSFSQHPLLTYRQRCNLTLRLPCGLRFRVRSIPDYQANTLPLIL